MMKSCVLAYALLRLFFSSTPSVVGAFLSSRSRPQDGTKRLPLQGEDEAAEKLIVSSAAALKDNGEAAASCCGRRSLLQNVVLTSGAVVLTGGATASIPSVTSAAEDAAVSSGSGVGKKPFAPVEALMPAIRVKRLIDRSVVLASELVQEEKSSATSSKQQQSTQDSVQELQTLLLKPQNFIDESSPIKETPIPNQPAQSYLDAYNRNRAQLNLLQQPGALLVERGEILAWKRLKRQENQAQQADEIRAALNLYTSRLTFSASEYVLQVPQAVRSQMIRNDALPDVKQVIQSDMGLRYLLRNEVLTSVADARAELLYQLQQQQHQPNLSSSNNGKNGSIIDARELLALLQQAQLGMDRWLSLIDEHDVREAVEAVERQQQEQSI